MKNAAADQNVVIDKRIAQPEKQRTIGRSGRLYHWKKREAAAAAQKKGATSSRRKERKGKCSDARNFIVRSAAAHEAACHTAAAAEAQKKNRCVTRHFLAKICTFTRFPIKKNFLSSGT